MLNILKSIKPMSPNCLLIFNPIRYLRASPNIMSEVLSVVSQKYLSVYIPAYTTAKQQIFTIDCKPDVGAFNNFALKYSGARRTYNAMHSHTIISSSSQAADQIETTSFGPGSLLFKLTEQPTDIIIIDTPFNMSLPFIHVAEQKLQYPTRKLIQLKLKILYKDTVLNIDHQYFALKEPTFNYVETFNEIGQHLIQTKNLYHIDDKLFIGRIADCYRTTLNFLGST